MYYIIYKYMILPRSLCDRTLQLCVIFNSFKAENHVPGEEKATEQLG